MKKKYESRVTSHESRREAASALILAVVLTSLLAIIGTVFLMVARVDKIATSAITENKELQFALESVAAEISQQLALDVPHSDPNRPPQEYYDYPDPCNAFLAALEPNESGFWRQISDVTGFIERAIPGVKASWDTQDIEITNSAPYLFKAIVEDHKKIELDNNGNLLEQLADADGDGVADSKWIELNNGMTTSKGKPIYVAVRVVDNGGMLNVNTAYKFDPTELLPPEELKKKIDGSSQLQINLMALSWRPGYCSYDVADETDLSNARCNNGVGVDPLNLALYEQNVIWRYGKLLMPYTPFGIDDELEMRNRFLLNHEGIDTRLEAWGGEFRKTVLSTPVTSGGKELDKWFKRTCFDPSILDPNLDPSDPNYYAYRHIATTYNMDRIITPVGPTLNYGKMLNVNRIDPNNNADPNIFDLYNFIRLGFADDANAAQLAVNIKDFSDSDPCVSVYNGHYGFEAQPFISEIGIKIDPIAPNDVNNNHFAVELYNPFNIRIPLDDLILSLSNGTDINLTSVIAPFIGPDEFFVVLDNTAEFPLPKPVNRQVSSDLKLSGDYVDADNDGTFESWENYDIALKRYIPDTGTEIYLDNQITEHHWFDPNVVEKYVQRDDTYWHIVYEDVNDSDLNPNTLGFTNNYRTTATNYNLALANHDFNTIGDVVLPLKIGPNTTPNGTIGRQLEAAAGEDEIRIDLTLPAYQHIFNYLTVMDPNNPQYGGHPATETRVKGRININTAPWFVIAQLPWMTPDIAQAVVSHRDTPGVDGFESIGELMRVGDMGYYGSDPNDLDVFPDLTPSDGAINDFEERDVIFARISNLVTVRSDVFTAYILVRIGVDGPQKRAIAILDRSKVNDVTDRVKLIALHPVPDPR